MPMLLRAPAGDAGLRWHDGGEWGLADSDQSWSSKPAYRCAPKRTLTKNT